MASVYRCGRKTCREYGVEVRGLGPAEHGKVFGGRQRCEACGEVLYWVRNVSESSETAHYGAVLHRSSPPLQVVGYYYPRGEQGSRQEVYRVEVTESEYQRVVTQIKRCGGSMTQKDEALFLAFKPENA